MENEIYLILFCPHIDVHYSCLHMLEPLAIIFLCVDIEMTVYLCCNVPPRKMGKAE